MVDINKWLDTMDLGSYASKLTELGYDNLLEINSFSEKDINEMISDVGFKKMHAKRIRKALGQKDKRNDKFVSGMSREEKALKEKLKKLTQERIAKEKEEAQKRKSEKKRLKAERHAQVEREIARRKAEKLRIKEERRREMIARNEAQAKITIERLQREVNIEYDFKSVAPLLEQEMKKFGEIEYCRASPVGLCVRYKSILSAKEALKSESIISNLPSNISPAEIKYHAIYFNAPEAMGKIDSEILTHVKNAMEAYGTVANIKKKGRSIVIFFDSQESAAALTSNEGSDVTLDVGGYTVALLAGVPPTQKKRRKQLKKAKKEAIKSGQPPSKKAC